MARREPLLDFNRTAERQSRVGDGVALVVRVPPNHHHRGRKSNGQQLGIVLAPNRVVPNSKSIQHNWCFACELALVLFGRTFILCVLAHLKEFWKWLRSDACGLSPTAACHIHLPALIIWKYGSPASVINPFLLWRCRILPFFLFFFSPLCLFLSAP